MTSPAIEFKSVQKSYGALDVVKRLDLSIAPGEFLVLLGPSGCGKSTILKMLAGIEDPTAGELAVNGKLVNYALPRDRDVAMVFQNYALYPHMNIADNIAYPLKSGRRGAMSKAEIAEKVREAAALVEIVDQLEKYPEALSGGQRQRVALARALVRDPAAFLMDEPLSNLDAQLRDTMRHQLIKLHRRIGKATIYVTHDQLEAMTMADRIVVMNGGVVQQSGTPEEVFHKPANLFVAGFVGYPKMNFFKGRSLGEGRVAVGEFELTTTCKVGPAGTPVTVGLRPSDAQSDATANAIAGTVSDVEFTGADTVVTLTAPGIEDLHLRQTSYRKTVVGEALSVGYTADHVHVFDADGNRL